VGSLSVKLRPGSQTAFYMRCWVSPRACNSSCHGSGNGTGFTEVGRHLLAMGITSIGEATVTNGLDQWRLSGG